MGLDNEIQNTASEGATPNEPETQQGENSVNAPNTAPDDSAAADGTSARSDGEGADPVADQNADNTPFLSFRFNHEDKALTREEAVNAAQIGLKYGALSEKLDRAAAIKGVNAESLLDSIINADREAYKASLAERLGEDGGEMIDRLMRVYDMEQAEKYKKSVESREAEQKQSEQSLNERLAAEFLELKAEFPEFLEYGSLPAEVRRAAENGKDLMSALLLHKHREKKAIAKAEQQAAAAAKATAGSLSGEGDNVNADEKSFLKGLFG